MMNVNDQQDVFCSYVDENGKMCTGTCKACDVATLAKELSAKGMYLVDYHPCGRKANRRFTLKKTLRDDKVSELCANMSMLLCSGLSMVQAVECCERQCRCRKERKALENAVKSVKEGKSLYESFKLSQGLFPEFMMQMMNAGELSGRLDGTFGNLEVYYHRNYEFKNKMKEALSYPVIVLVIGAAILIFMWKSVLPQLIEAMSEMGAEVPESSMVLINTFAMAERMWLPLAMGGTFVFFLCSFDATGERIKKHMDTMKLKIPIVRKIEAFSLINKFSACMEMLLNSGFNIISALETSSRVISNVKARQQLDQCMKKIKSGSTLGEALKNTAFSDDAFDAVVEIGENSGNLETSFTRAREIYEKRLDKCISKLKKCCEPALLIILAISIGSVVKAFMEPMMNMMQNIK